jgi:hypothetical protein
MPRSAAAAGVVLLGVIVAGCSSANTATAPEKAAATAIMSLDASPYVQLTESVSTDAVTGSGTSVAETKAILKNVKLVISASSDDTSKNLSAAGQQESVDLSVDYGSTTLGQFRTIDGKQLYFRLDISSWSVLPITLSPSTKSTISELQTLVGDRWFSLPSSLLTNKSVKKDMSKAQATQIDTALLQALTKNTTFSTGLGKSGESEIDVSGSLKNLVKSLEPVVGQLQQLGAAVPAAGVAGSSLSSVSGNYLVKLFTDSSGNLKELTASVTSNGKHVALDMLVGHAAAPITAPTGATPFSMSLIQRIALGFASAST